MGESGPVLALKMMGVDVRGWGFGSKGVTQVTVDVLREDISLAFFFIFG